MLKVKRIATPFGSDSRDIEEKLNEFFWAHNLTKDDIVHISKVTDTELNYIAFYVFFDEYNEFGEHE